MKKTFLHHERPLLTTMLQAETPLRMRELIRKGLAGGTDAFGLQIEHLGRAYRTRNTFTWLFEEMGDKPCYVTDYRFVPGQSQNDDELTEELLLLVDCGATLVDVMGDLYAPAELQFTEDARAVARQEKLIRRIHAMGGEVLMSSHTGCFLPEDRVVSIMKEQHRRGADVAKVVTVADHEAQLAENMRISAILPEKLDKKEHLFLCGGEACPLHRRLGPLMGNTMFLCVAEQDEFSTVYQPTLERAKKLVELACEGIAYR